MFVPLKYVREAIPLIDLWIVDIKRVDSAGIEEILHGEAALYKNNINLLLESTSPIILRIPVIGGFTDSEEQQDQVCDFIDKLEDKGNILQIELVQEHNLGLNKYYSLKAVDDSICLPEYRGVKDEVLTIYKEKLEKVINNEKIKVDICKL